MTSQGSAYPRFRRALDGGNATIALAAAAELDFVSLPAQLELVLLLVDEPGKFRRAAFRWHARYCADVSDVGFEEAQAVLAYATKRRQRLTGKHREAFDQALEWAQMGTSADYTLPAVLSQVNAETRNAA